jgi:protein arginine kinase activator
MICERCHKRMATMRFTEVVNGRPSVRNICEVCLSELEGNANTGFELSGAPQPKRIQAGEERKAVSGQKTCSACGMELRSALENGRVGCSQCFDTFADQLDPILRELHPSLRHRGKMAHLDDSRERLRADLQTKRALLRSALKLENYEEAAVLRDTIKNMEAGMSGSKMERN